VSDHSELRVRVLLKGTGKQSCMSPAAYPQAEAERLLAQIDQARRQEIDVSLPWLTVSGKDVLAAALEDATPDSTPRSIDEVLAGLKRRLGTRPASDR
jgi:hypothetical protein